MRKIPKRNYVIYGLVCVLTCALLIGWVNMYNNSKEYYDSTNERMNFLKEIKESEISNFLTENNDYAIYFSDSEDINNEDFENKLRKKLIKKDYINDIVYVNTNELSIDLLKLVNDEYQVNFDRLPNLIVVADGSIQDTYYFGEYSKVEDIITILEAYYD